LGGDGEPLPGHAIARLGSGRLFHPRINRLAFSPDGSVLASSGEGGVRIWHATTGQQLARLPVEARSTFAFSSDGQFLATALPVGGWPRLWCPFTGRLMRGLRQAGSV